MWAKPPLWRLVFCYLILLIFSKAMIVTATTRGHYASLIGIGFILK
jgi:hypothetical protein